MMQPASVSPPPQPPREPPPARSDDLPGRLQATFLPGRGLAFWGLPDPNGALLGLGLRAGSATVAPLALPVGRGAERTVSATTVPVTILTLDEAVRALSSLSPGTGDDASIGQSVWAWQRAARLAVDDAPEHGFDDLARRMPAAAHAILDERADAIPSARSLLAQFRLAVTTRRGLSDSGVQADLRPYQVDGVAWLRSLAGTGGGVLADEMGLGKTLQAICLMSLRDTGGPHLVVCPTSVVGNWQRELARFIPNTPVTGYWGPHRELPHDLAPGAVVVTSYSLLRQDVKELSATDWDVVILDEAQQIKNPDALATQAAQALSAQLRIAMTGTPVENRLDELWSILNVTNPGLLGTRSRFRQRFATPVEQRHSPTAARRLNALLAPQLLRRRKDDVALDLPPKQQSLIACTLTAEQVDLYRRAVADAFDTGFGAGIERRGRVLALLTRLKQVCNHPTQALGDTEPLAGRSGKFDRASEMLTEISDQGDRALVFTQYRAMGELLCRHLDQTLGAAPTPFLHGGLGAERRDQLVEAFQHDEDASPVLVLSLRAAGFGLNLTRASHVMHYDRWWNPAVEDQATDRAHRIGQRRSLNVHTLVTLGTIEEHIATMHASKRTVANLAAGNSEIALAQLPDSELRALLALDADSAS